jgi:ribosomal protein L11 methyltransferase
MAFGTGQHATTRSCLEALEKLMPLPADALDVGTGTGVLAIALAKLGVRRVVALDTDPQAVTAARGNLKRNGVEKRVRLACRSLEEEIARGGGGRGGGARSAGGGGSGRSGRGDGGTSAARRVPLVVANLYVDVLVALAPTLADVVAPGGHLVTSGVLRAQQGRLRAAYGAPAWRVVQARRAGTWTTTVFRRVAGARHGARGATAHRRRAGVA